MRQGKEYKDTVRWLLNIMSVPERKDGNSWHGKEFRGSTKDNLTFKSRTEETGVDRRQGKENNDRTSWLLSIMNLPERNAGTRNSWHRKELKHASADNQTSPFLPKWIGADRRRRKEYKDTPRRLLSQVTSGESWEGKGRREGVGRLPEGDDDDRIHEGENVGTV